MSAYSLPLLIASDHAGFNLKHQLQHYRTNLNWKDLGCFSDKRTDYPDWADKLCHSLQDDMFGILICGTGQGMCIKANRYPKICAAVCWDKTIARLSRSHNNSNVLCLAGRFLNVSQALDILDTFLNTNFNDQDIYRKRWKKLQAQAPSV